MRFLTSGLVLAALLACASVQAADDFKLEPGFTLLLNGKDLTGWKTKTGGEVLDGKAEAEKGRFKVAEGALVIDPKVKGDLIINTAKDLSGDLTIKFQFKPGTGCNNDLFLLGTKFDLKKEDVKNWKLDEWNDFEIVVTGKKAEFKCNNEALKTLATKAEKSPLGIRAEFGPVQIRHLRVKEGK